MPEPTPAINPSAAPSLSRQVLDRIADRWTILVFLALVDGPQHFSDTSSRSWDALDGPIAAVQQWAVDHMAEVFAAREAYDPQRAKPVA